jgi:hypothetical protein
MSFTSPEKDFFFYISDVITAPEKEKRSSIHYSRLGAQCARTPLLSGAGAPAACSSWGSRSKLRATGF